MKMYQMAVTTFLEVVHIHALRVPDQSIKLGAHSNKGCCCAAKSAQTSCM